MHKKLSLLFPLPAALATLLLAVPAAADSPKVPVGEKINVLLGSPTTFPAGTPFHIRHGWGLAPADQAIGIWSFRLDVDGVPRDPDFVLRSTDPVPSTGYEYPIPNRALAFYFT